MDAGDNRDAPWNYYILYFVQNKLDFRPVMV